VGHRRPPQADKERAAARTAEAVGRSAASGRENAPGESAHKAAAATSSPAPWAPQPMDRHGKVEALLRTTATPPLSPSVAQSARAPFVPNPNPPHSLDQAHLRSLTHHPNHPNPDYLSSPTGIRVPPLPPLGTPQTELQQSEPIDGAQTGPSTARSLKSPRYRGPAAPLQVTPAPVSRPMRGQGQGKTQGLATGVAKGPG
jgi:hypothetical protein